MANEGTDFNTPLGRIVWGHPLNPQNKTDQQTRQPVRNEKGEIIQQWAFGLAIPKAEIGAMWAVMQAEAAKGYPNGVPGNFSWKLKDGDGVDNNGKPYSAREGWAGCYVLTVTTELKASGTFVYQNGAYRQLQPNEIKTGDYVTCGINFKVNVPTNRSHTPGLYVNPLSVLLMYEGDEIKSGFEADPNTIHGAQPQQMAMPAGARPVGSGGPVGSAPPAGAAMPGMPGAGPTPQMPGAPAATGLPGVGLPAAASVPPPVAAPPAGPQRPTDPAHVHNNGDGTEQWAINGVWDGQRHPIAAAAPTLPPPATDFVTGALPGAPQMQPGGMPGMPPPR